MELWSTNQVVSWLSTYRTRQSTRFINLKNQKLCENKITNICSNVLVNYAVNKKLSLHKIVSKVVNNKLSSTRKNDEVSSSRSLLENYEIHYLECVCAGLFWRNIQKSSTGTFAFQIIYHLTSLLGTHFGVDGARNNLLFMEVINLILTYIKKTLVYSCNTQITKWSHIEITLVLKVTKRFQVNTD